VPVAVCEMHRGHSPWVYRAVTTAAEHVSDTWDVEVYLAVALQFPKWWWRSQVWGRAGVGGSVEGHRCHVVGALELVSLSLQR
jgi:hypothetical protein